ncbi:unnamed protein product [Rotaria socialis]|uniref:Uncharacterized protein n=1 Tax=Rotaria socialis TaxID=392032 RepID=A0A821X6Z9_9BILA|nr:unnamed protein product [Rotaria socialis]
MTRASLDISRLPHDVFTYSNQRFFDFIESFCGKDEADLLSIQAIRSVDSFLSVQDVYSIFAVDSEDVIEIQARCAFKNRNEQWYNQNKNDLNLCNLNFVCGIDYHLKFSSSLDKVAVICSCGLKSSLVRADSGNFKVSNYFRHLKTTCSIVQSQSIDNSTEHEQIRSNIVISRDSSLLLSSQQPSTVSTIKRARQTTAVNINKKKLRTT